jgi:hypothetical protein
VTLERQSGGHENTFGRRQQVPQSVGGAGVDCRAGYQVISTADGEQALRLARELTPALILLGRHAAQDEWSVLQQQIGPIPREIDAT